MPVPAPGPSDVSSRSALRPIRPKRHLDLGFILAAHDRQGHLVTHLMLTQGDDQAVSRGDALAVDGGDDVALLDTRLGSRAVGGDLATYAPLSTASSFVRAL